jgi:hypothetical protein
MFRRKFDSSCNSRHRRDQAIAFFFDDFITFARAPLDARSVQYRDVSVIEFNQPGMFESGGRGLDGSDLPAFFGPLGSRN